MTLEEHLDTMTEFTRDSDEIFTGDGNTLAAAEFLWGALAHGLVAVAEVNAWRCEGHQGYRQVARQLQASTRRQRWRSDVAAGEQLHRHFYQGHLTGEEIKRFRAATG
jgi:hypothetical protein